MDVLLNYRDCCGSAAVDHAAGAPANGLPGYRIDSTRKTFCEFIQPMFNCNLSTLSVVLGVYGEVATSRGAAERVMRPPDFNNSFGALSLSDEEVSTSYDRSKRATKKLERAARHRYSHLACCSGGQQPESPSRARVCPQYILDVPLRQPNDSFQTHCRSLYPKQDHSLGCSPGGLPRPLPSGGSDRRPRALDEVVFGVREARNLFQS